MKKKYIVVRNNFHSETVRQYIRVLNVQPGQRESPWTEQLKSAFKFPNEVLAQKTMEKFSANCTDDTIFQISPIYVKDI